MINDISYWVMAACCGRAILYLTSCNTWSIMSDVISYKSWHFPLVVAYDVTLLTSTRLSTITFDNIDTLSSLNLLSKFVGDGGKSLHITFGGIMHIDQVFQLEFYRYRDLLTQLWDLLDLLLKTVIEFLSKPDKFVLGRIHQISHSVPELLRLFDSITCSTRTIGSNLGETGATTTGHVFYFWKTFSQSCILG